MSIDFAAELSVNELKEALRRARREANEAKNKTAEYVEAVYRAAHDASLTLELAKVERPTRDQRRKHAEVAVPWLSDWQLAKVTPSYNSDICEERIERYADRVIELTEIQRADHPVRDAHVVITGDIIEGELIFPGQQFLIDASLYNQVCVTGPRILTNFLRRMLSEFDRIHVTAVIGNHGCADEDTEILTENGWKFYDEVTVNDRIATLDANGAFQWQYPSEYVKYWYEGDMHWFKGLGVDHLVTPNHDLVVNEHQINHHGRVIREAHDYVKIKPDQVTHRKLYHAPTAAKSWEGTPYGETLLEWRDGEHYWSSSHPGSLKISELDMAELAGWYVSEGNAGLEGRITISQRHDSQYTPEIVKLIEKLGFKPQFTQHNAVRFSFKPLARFLHDEFGDVSHRKRVPRWLKEAPTPVLAKFLDALFKGDGDVSYHVAADGVAGSRKYRTTSDHLIDDLHEIAIKVGANFTSTERYETHWRHGDGTKTLSGSCRAGSMSYTRRSVERMLPPSIPTYYQGYVWCPRVENANWFARRNGKVQLTGNSMGGRARKDYNPETNADRMLYRIVQGLLQDEKRITWTIPDGPNERNWYAIAEIGNYRALCLHGDQFRGSSGMPWYSLQKKVGGWALGAIEETFNEVLFGHYHQPTRLTLNTVTARCSGSTESHNTYAQEQLAAVGQPSQNLLFVHPEKGIVTADYCVWLND